MHKSDFIKAALAFSCVFLLMRAGAAAQAQAPSPPSASAPAITAADAQRAIDILQDDTRRAELLRTLKAIAAAAPASSATAAAQGAPAAGDTAASTPAGSPPPAEPANSAPGEAATDGSGAAAPDTIVPLEAGGLMARTLRSLDDWMDDFVGQLGVIRDAAIAIPALLAQSNTVMTPANKRLMERVALALLGTFALGLALEWALHRALRRPRQALAEHADRLAQRHDGARAASALETAHGVRQDAAADAPADATQAGLRPAHEGVALVHAHRDGVDSVEPVPVGRENAAGAPPASDADRPVEPARKVDEETRKHSRQHWRTLRNLPYALGALVLDVLPIALFFVAASLALRLFAGSHPRTVAVTADFIQAYVALRLTMAVMRLLVSPAGQGLRLLHIGPATAALLLTWTRRIVGLAVFGMAVADAAALLGAGLGLRGAFIKAVSLLVHLGAVVLIVKLRRPVRSALRAPAGASGPLAVARNWFADAWAVIAVVLVMGIWVVWALGVEDGFPKLVHFVLVSAAVLVAARLLAILLLGALGRLFTPDKTEAATDAANGGAQRGARLSDRYYPWMRGLVSVVITLCTVIALFQSWGLDALDWFAPGTLGRSMAGAALTIVVAVIVAILVWEAAQYAVERRLQRWQRQGDMVRAARLRTLLPMLRTALFIVVALIVGLTALNQIGINTTPLLAGASIIGVALGFGSQKLVQDFITGIFLLMENAMRVGDWVTVAGVSGSVEYLSIRTVRVRGGDGALHIVPFSSVSTVTNSNRGIGNAAVRISVAYDTDIDRVVSELKQIGAALRADPAFQDQILNDIEVWGVDSVDGSMVTLVGQMRCSDKGRWGVQREINRRILERFRELGIEIANPRASLLLPADGSPLATPGTPGDGSAPGKGPSRDDGQRPAGA
ncbi:hypothetical protein CAL14_05705 [Bordetella genomosp. 9]|uniref:mechanosensitive ion channel family protein n=1 Tax=Bordetella genomosp. 9 TaxID=1416803 RepID=UPI000A29599E|nr:mechanosensitive ion channel family protein [Bordetella genomosp. 9]ARP89847.1 hypothetical protein CAL14_05705 [Bordetella genomosp. 9]